MKKNLVRVSKIAALAFALSLFGCATARVVNTQPGRGGEIAINPPQSADARQKAEEIMRTNCGEKQFKIVNEGEVVVGKVTNSEGSVDAYGNGNGFNTNQTSYTSNQTEWRLTYKCM